MSADEPVERLLADVQVLLDQAPNTEDPRADTIVVPLEGATGETKLEVVSGWVTREDLLDRAKAHRVDEARARESANSPDRSPIGRTLSNERAIESWHRAEECESICAEIDGARRPDFATNLAPPVWVVGQLEDGETPWYYGPTDQWQAWVSDGKGGHRRTRVLMRPGGDQDLGRQHEQELEIRREAHAQLDQAEVRDGFLDVRVASLVERCAQYRKRLADQQSPFLQSGGPLLKNGGNLPR